tara:strand:+ start:97 stop:360 length:264 start_codon:yes stop_codon:yes gene_type:complete
MVFKNSGAYISNPFSIYWKKNWTFQIVHMEGGIHLEAKGLGISLRAPFLPNDNPLLAADSLILKEEKNRRSLYNSWKLKTRNQNLQK